MTMEASCHCGTITLTIADAPKELTDCNCSICRRYGVLWAYYPLKSVIVLGGPIDAYMWDDRAIRFNRCRGCGCVTHWSPEDAATDRMGVNARLMELEILQKVRIRHLDGAKSERYLD